jgi:uncharacterized protein YcaQ
MGLSGSAWSTLSQPMRSSHPRVTSIRTLRAHALAHSLFAPTSLPAALDRLAFVQADPIRAPARAQDLILRPRVKGYRAGDLEAQYPTLDLEEDLLYAYGFLTRPAWRLLHPRALGAPTKLEQRILAHVRAGGPTHPRTLEEHFGGARVVNAWGGSSKQTTDALERLHRRGLLRVARRENGLRVYEAIAPGAADLSEAAFEDRLARLVLLVAHVLAPVAEPTLHTISAYLARWLPRPRRGAAANPHRAVVRTLLADGRLERAEEGGRAYVWPAGTFVDDEAPRRVTFLAPFDPVVWDRRRFEHLWHWAYRFEAYTPVAKRVRGYYALPLLWGDAVIGWANAATSSARGTLEVQCGYVAGQAPRARDFRRELDAEIARLETFLRPRRP